MLQTQAIKDEKNPGNRGFTIIEVMVALVIFTFGILGVYAMQISSINGNAAARKRTEAVSWAANQMEILIKTPYAATGNNQITQGIYNIQWTVAEIDINNDGANDAKNIQINVTWNGRGRPMSTTLSYIKIAD